LARPRRSVALAALAALAAALVAAGCGEAEERTMTAREFVAEMNRNGAALKLGPVLTENADGVPINEVEITRTAPTPTGEGSEPEASGHATLIVLGDAEEATGEYDRCQGAPSLSCYRAANVVLRVEDLQPTDRALLTSAISALASEG
jgi:hypothetical protein